jgi:hypothetical protein
MEQTSVPGEKKKGEMLCKMLPYCTVYGKGEENFPKRKKK